MNLAAGIRIGTSSGGECASVRPITASKRNHTMKVDNPFGESAKDKDMKHSREPS